MKVMTKARRVPRATLLVILTLAGVVISLGLELGAGGGGTSSSLSLAIGPEHEVSLTIYEDLALVSELRMVELEPVLAGQLQEVVLEGLPEKLLPSSVHLEGLESELEVLEGEFRYEPLSKRALLERFIGEEIEVRDAGGVYRGTLLGVEGDGEEVILQDWAGEVQIITAPVGFALPSLPEPEPATEPRLILKLRSESEQVGRQPVRLSYLTRGLSWWADYLAILDLDRGRMDLDSFVSVSNSSGKTFRDAALRLVAGKLHRVGERELGYGYVKAMEEMALAQAAPQFAEEAAFEYHLYTLERPATLEDGRTKQLGFISAREVQVERRYVFEPARGSGIRVEISFTNSALSGLGQPLPAGRVRLYQRQGKGDELLFVGEDLIPHTPVDEEVSLTVGVAFDLTGERRQLERRRIAPDRYRETILITLANHKEEAVTIEVIEHPPGDWVILSATPAYEKVDANTIKFVVPVSPGGEATVRYTVEYQL